MPFHISGCAVLYTLKFLPVALYYLLHSASHCGMVVIYCDTYLEEETSRFQHLQQHYVCVLFRAINID